MASALTLAGSTGLVPFPPGRAGAWVASDGAPVVESDLDPGPVVTVELGLSGVAFVGASPEPAVAAAGASFGALLPPGRRTQFQTVPTGIPCSLAADDTPTALADATAASRCFVV